ncbi:hypothetical protein H3C65_03840 [Patescibacteria group bacterium]|nr:hypothetical protein [Patescibacteria group bacterium]
MIKEVLTQDISENKIEHKEFPIDPFDRMDRILGGAINMGPKSVLMMLLPNFGGYISTRDLGDRFRQVIGNSDPYFSSVRNDVLAAYCDQSLNSVGLVAKIYKASPTDSAYGFSLTEAGDKYGKRSAALALKFEFDNSDISLYSIIGQTATTSKKDHRAPGLRARILIELNNSGNTAIDIPTLAQRLGRNIETVTQALKILEDQDCLKKQSGGSIYQFAKDNVDKTPVYKRYSKLSEAIYKFIQEVRNKKDFLSLEELISEVSPQFEGTWNKTNLINAIRLIMNDFVRQGVFLENKSGKKGSTNFYNISQKGSLIVNNFLNPLYLLMIDDVTITESFDRQVVEIVEKNLKAYAEAAVRRYSPYSKGQARKEKGGIITKIVELLTKFGKSGATMEDIIEAIGCSKRKTISKYLEIMEQEDYIEIMKTANPKEYRYRIKKAS